MKAYRAILAACALACAATVAHASDNKIAIVVGGPHPYFASMEGAAADVKKQFNIGEVQYRVPQEWDVAQQNKLIESLVSTGSKAFLLAPGDPVGSVTMMNELKDSGIISAVMAGCVSDPSPAQFCMATDVYKSANMGTKELIKAMGGSGNIVHFTGLFADSNTQLRIKAVEDAVAETGGKVKLLQTIADIDSPQPADEKINAFLASQGAQTNGIISTAWIPSVVASTSLRTLGDKRIKMVAIDHDPIVLGAIKDGFINGTMLQNPYGQAYLGTYVLDKVLSGCKFKADAPFAKTAQTAKFIDTGTLFIGADQVDKYVDGLKALTDQLRAKIDSDFLSCS
jgi:ribose transport system substrate-binding protein